MQGERSAPGPDERVRLGRCLFRHLVEVVALVVLVGGVWVAGSPVPDGRHPLEATADWFVEGRAEPSARGGPLRALRTLADRETGSAGRLPDRAGRGPSRDGEPPLWSVALLPTIQRAFADAFGRPLPVSALGQTPLHERMGLDHRNAVDVAVHPDSAEGRWLTAYLERAGIPFLAIPSARRGWSTGPHIHIGPASPALPARQWASGSAG